MHPTRRDFLGGIAGGVVAGTLLRRLPLLPGRVPESPQSIDELVTWIADVKHEQANAELLDRLKKGLAVEPLFAALYLAGLRHVEPRPLGFKYHCVLQMASLWNVMQALPPPERALPLVYALDDFKRSQAEQVAAGDWRLPAPDENALPAAGKARAEFDAAMEAWDLAKADAAVTSLVRNAKREEVIAALAPWSLRSFGNAGHGAICAANGIRTLDVIGWGHAEPFARALVHGLLELERSADTAAFARAKERARVAPGKARGGFDAALPAALAALRKSDSAQAQQLFADLERETGSMRAGWLTACAYALELLARTPGLFAVHAATGVESIQWLATAVGELEFARLAQSLAAGWLPLWREAFVRGGTTRDVDVALLLAPANDATVEVRGAVRALEGLGPDRWATARSIVGGLRVGNVREIFVARARELLVAKGDEPHDWKFFVALGQLATRCGDEMAGPLLACGVHYLRDAADADFAPVATARAALAK
ncbi:MAG TPA: hypothetical protein VFG37_06060 [Planctomycetota bacterium]|jgi:hypothetical protein|nr:hypothetical protein [Planctomycetota bacterium]